MSKSDDAGIFPRENSWLDKGLLLLLTWPFPKENRPDVTFPLSGMLLHLAMQNWYTMAHTLTRLIEMPVL
jgi:hypothetical protein